MLIKNNTIARLLSVFVDRNFMILSFMALCLLMSATIAVYFIEVDVNPEMTNFLDSLWWGVTTVTTIGFGDIVPITIPGRIIGIILMLTGPVLFVLFTGALLKILIKEGVDTELSDVESDLQKEGREVHEIREMLLKINDRLNSLEKK